MTRARPKEKPEGKQDVDARARRSLTPKPPPWGRRLGQEDERRKRRCGRGKRKRR